MSQILSQEEVDALLQGISNGEVETERAPAPQEEVVVYDFRQQERLLLEGMESLGIVFDRFAKNMRGSFTDLLHRVVDVNLAGKKGMGFSEFIDSLPVPTSFNILRVGPVNGSALLVIEAKLVFSLVELLFGGTAQEATKVEGREFTPIELRIVSRVTRMILKDLERAWEVIYPLKFEYEKTELDPKLAGIVPPDEAVMAARFEVELENPIGVITLCMPSLVLKPIRKELEQRGKLEERVDPVWRGRLYRALLNVPVTVEVEFGTLKMSPKELLGIRIGDVVRLPKGVDDELIVKVEKVPKFRGTAGLSRGQRAVQITAPII
ncbi:MAG: flagellar motor switch protein FliM [Deltaproteobacteria bacterium]|nr:MAG: flagellar motor switch protein FliM [Deltaproteobacteria bacterium]